MRTHSHGVAQYSQLMVEFLTLLLVALIAWIFAGPWAADALIRRADAEVPAGSGR